MSAKISDASTDFFRIFIMRLAWNVSYLIALCFIGFFLLRYMGKNEGNGMVLLAAANFIMTSIGVIWLSVAAVESFVFLLKDKTQTCVVNLLTSALIVALIWCAVQLLD